MVKLTALRAVCYTKIDIQVLVWRGVRVVEGGGLENR